MDLTLESLADKLETLNENTRELLYKLYLWDTEEGIDKIPVNLRVPSYPFIQTFHIPTKKSVTEAIKGSSASTPKSKVKNWGSYSNNTALQGSVSIPSNDIHNLNILKYDGPDVEGATTFVVEDGDSSSELNFLVTVLTSHSYSDKKVVKLVDPNGNLICGITNTPVSPIKDSSSVLVSGVPLVFKVSLRYVTNSSGGFSWRVFDFYSMPSYRYNGSSGFDYSKAFADPST